MNTISRGFTGRRPGDVKLPPGQYLEHGFPVLQTGPTPSVRTATWTFTITTETGETRRWDWKQFTALPSEDITVDIHCVTQWSYGGYTTNLPLPDLRDGQAWIAYEYDRKPLRPEHGGPARLLVPHLYFWKSAKWVTGLDLMRADSHGFWEGLGYHDYGDPWREQRYQGD
jgi:DMSO/TMAO reductase YedYZ molybdopterin-dependent catalytic subunit